MSDVVYTLAHVGVNAQNPEEALALARAFAEVFNLTVKEGNSSNFAGAAVEVMKKDGPGRLGHIGFGVADCEAAVEDLRARGHEVDMQTAKYKDGRLNAVYLQEEIGGFAVHIVRKA